MNNTEFERNQITRKGVFVKAKRSAPQPPPRTIIIEGSNADATRSGFRKPTNDESQVVTRSMASAAIRNQPATTTTTTSYVNQYNSKLKATDIGPFAKPKDGGNTNDIIDNNEDNDDSSIAMLDRLEKQINRLEFDTRMAPKDTPAPVETPVFKKPVHYTGLESLLNTGVSDVATEHGIGYFEKDPDEELNLEADFRRNAEARQSFAGHAAGKVAPSMAKSTRPVARTASDTDQMKDVVIKKQTFKTQDTSGRDNATISLRTTTSLREKERDSVVTGVASMSTTTPVTTTRLQTNTGTNARPLPADVRKYIGAQVSAKVITINNFPSST